MRDYQQECLDEIARQPPGAYLIQMCMGLGKTVTFSRIPSDGRTLILSHREELVHQPAKYYDCSVGFEINTEHSAGEPVVSASVQSLVRRLDKFQPDEFDVVICDECFPAGTQVDGKNIEDIKEKDFVTAFNHETGEAELRRVTHKFKRTAPDELVSINGEMVCTRNHPVYIVGRGYVDADKIEPGDYMLRRMYGDHVIGLFVRDMVESVEVFKRGCDERYANVCPDGYVYNLEVDGLNNYFANDILVHNCHHAAAKTYKKILSYFKPRILLGFTATPNRGDKVRLDDVFSKIIFQRDLKWGIKNGWLCDIYCERVHIGYDLSSVHTRNGDYAPGELDMAMEGTADAIAEVYRERAVGATLIFAVSVRQCNEIAEKIPGAVAVTADTKNRAEIVDAFTEGRIPCIVNCMVFTEGTDIPRVETIIMARPTQSETLYQQAAGRGLRLYPGKKYLKLIDCVGITGKARLCTAPSLVGIDMENLPERYRDCVQGDLFDLEMKASAAADTPDSWIMNVEIVNLWAQEQNYDTHGINFFKMPDGQLIVALKNRDKIVIPAPDSLGDVCYRDGRKVKLQDAIDETYERLKNEFGDQRYIWDMNKVEKWTDHPATEKQLSLIKKKCSGFNMKNLTKGQASMVLNRLLN